MKNATKLGNSIAGKQNEHALEVEAVRKSTDFKPWQQRDTLAAAPRARPQLRQ